ncbi:thiamine ABC transporter substrate-binding protein [Natrononativus amylolyticus]|uniref:thiamine ABC transporter substrate-binding protein n=1 Tax=Natrononativus amylolyticus TaxID=2963434 RepID=UPI0020CDDD79|nr:thiamine ABC transporter substrate-binding protein [Natrononativus amylolyticus]
MKRRTFLASGVTTATLGVAGCISEVDDEGENGADDTSDDTETSDDGGANGDDGADTLTVATYGSFIDAPSDSAGEWVKEQFDERFDATLEWSAPDQEVNYFIERHNADAGIDADVYLGVRPHDLVRIDQSTDGGLLAETDESRLDHAADIGEEYYFDPEGRAIPSYRSFCSLVYNGHEVENPGSFEALLEDQYKGRFGLPNPQEGTTGLLFLLWTINEFGEDGYLEYWNDLLDNDARIVNSWSDLYPQFENDEIPVVVSYSNDRVYAKRAGNDLEKHQVGFLDGEAYANMLGMAPFADASNEELAYEFMDFILEPEIQAGIAERNVTGPVNQETTPPEVYREYAEEPDEIVFFDYEELSGNLDDWVDEWGREIAGGR